MSHDTFLLPRCWFFFFLFLFGGVMSENEGSVFCRQVTTSRESSQLSSSHFHSCVVTSNTTSKGFLVGFFCKVSLHFFLRRAAKDGAAMLNGEAPLKKMKMANTFHHSSVLLRPFRKELSDGSLTLPAEKCENYFYYWPTSADPIQKVSNSMVLKGHQEAMLLLNAAHFPPRTVFFCFCFLQWGFISKSSTLSINMRIQVGSKKHCIP